MSVSTLKYFSGAASPISVVMTVTGFRKCLLHSHNNFYPKFLYFLPNFVYSNAVNFRFASTYSSTVNLPKSTLVQYLSSENTLKRDGEINKMADFDSHYQWQWEKGDDPPFILHDGPPYANGQVHMGHAINKILKDITNRFWVVKGRKVHYVPGWDCHGLPIEQKILKSGDMENMAPLTIRIKADKFSKETVKSQEESFKRWGVMGDWKHKYLTSSPMYICNELESFWRCYQKGLISRSLKPVFWSPSSCTALAEAELEYNPNHKSTSVYVQFPLECFPEDWKSVLGNKKLSLLIWTTTPWTLPANQAVAYSGKSKYCLVHKISSQHVWIVAQELISEVNEKLKSNLEVLRSFDGDVLGQCQYQHPFTESRLLPLLNGGHVTMSKGTGLVHTAPNHGSDDFKLAAKYKIPNEECLVDENGCYIQSAPKDLQSLDVLGQGTNSVLKLLGDNLVLAEEYMHSYPYDWRTKKPVIVRASNQWFFDVESIKEKAMNCLESVNFYPPNAKISMKKTLESCPQWCISRQRVWGVPIPVLFKGIDGTPLINQDLINRVCNLVKETGGANFWWSHGVEEIIPQDFLKKNGIASTTELEKGADILDIWFDSGTSWYSSSLPKNPADLYLEGIDQFRGWFQSSLLTSVALNSEPPYKSVYVHGFALDQAGLKMSKSLGNVIDPFTITNGSQEGKNKIPALGIDTLRWWVAYYGSSNENVEILQTLLKESHSNVNKLRNTFRFILGNLNGFDYDEDEIKIENMLLVDKYMLHYLNDFQTKVENAYLALKFGVVCYHVLHLFVNRLSSFYFPAIKDRLYCNYEKSPLRRSCQSVLHHILEVSLRSLAPILPHLAEEVRLNHPNINYNKHSIFKRKTSIIESSQWENKELEKLIKTVEIIKYTLEKQNIKNTKDFDIVLVGEPEKIRPIKLLEKMNQHGNSELNHILQTASVEIGSSDDDCLAQMEFDHSFDISDLSLKVYFSKSKKSVCLRCRLRNVFNSLNRECLCDRCINALKQMQ